MEKHLKIIIVGNNGVGKTSLVQQYCIDTKLSMSDYIPTIGINFNQKILKFHKDKIKLIIWDTAGEVEFHTMVLPMYKSSNIVIIMYDITDRLTFLEVPYWVEKIKHNVLKPPLIALIGNKIDLDIESNRVVSYDEADDFANNNGLVFMEITSQNKESVNIIFNTLINHVYLNELNSQEHGIKRGCVIL